MALHTWTVDFTNIQSSSVGYIEKHLESDLFNKSPYYYSYHYFALFGRMSSEGGKGRIQMSCRLYTDTDYQYNSNYKEPTDSTVANGRVRIILNTGSSDEVLSDGWINEESALAQVIYDGTPASLSNIFTLDYDQLVLSRSDQPHSLFVEMQDAGGGDTWVTDSDGTERYVRRYRFDLYYPGITKGTTITYASPFYETGNPYIEYDEPLLASTSSTVKNCQVGVFLKANDTQIVAYQSMSPWTGSYTLALSDAEREALTTYPTGTPIYFKVITDIDSSRYTTTFDHTLTIVTVAPTITATVVDTNVETLYLTGNENTLIRYYSTADYSVTATAVNGATMAQMTASHGGFQDTYSVSGTSATKTGRFSNAESGVFYFTATDHRGNIGRLTVTKKCIPYVKITCNLLADPPTGEGHITLTVHGNCYSGSFGAHDNNLVVLYRYKEAGGTWGDWITTTNVTTDSVANSYTGTISLEGFDYLKTYVFQARAYDLIGTIDSAEKVVTTVPVFDWGKQGFAFNVPTTYIDWDNDVKYSITGATKAMATAYSLATTVTTHENYTVAGEQNAFLLGNQLRCYLYVLRDSPSQDGNFTNELVAHYKIKHSGKIKSLYNTNFISGSAGGIGAFYTTNATNDGTYVEFDVGLAATSAINTEFSAFFTMPIIIDTFAY